MKRLKITGKVRVGREFEVDATVEGQGDAVSTVAWLVLLAGALSVGGAFFWFWVMS